MSSATTNRDTGRHYLVTLNGEPFCEARPAYLQTREEATEVALKLKVQYGGDYGIVDTGVPARCVSNYPYNGSACNGLVGHEGPCWYVEPLDGKPREWAKGGAS